MSIPLQIAYLIVIFFFLYVGFRKYILSYIIRNQKFICTRCGHCCRYFVQLTPEDIKRIEATGKKDFTEKKWNMTIIKQKNSYCPFLSINKGIARCNIYNNRPKICRDFPRMCICGIKMNDYRCTAFNRPKYLSFL